MIVIGSQPVPSGRDEVAGRRPSRTAPLDPATTFTPGATLQAVF